MNKKGMMMTDARRHHLVSQRRQPRPSTTFALSSSFSFLLIQLDFAFDSF